MGTKLSNGMKPYKSQLIATIHFPAHLMDTHSSYSTLAENAAIHFGTNSTHEIP